MYVIEIAGYDPAWPGRFRALAAELRRELAEVALRIDHIGSTAVPGLGAKPVIDLQISVADFEPLEQIRRPLAGLGYVFRQDNDDLTKRYFREPTGEPRTHIHVRRAGSWSEQYALLFRDYMRAHPAEAAGYEALKRELADRLGRERHAYTEAKGPFIWEAMRRASDWSQAVGWRPGPSDA